jgi:hypothetical protein
MSAVKSTRPPRIPASEMSLSAVRTIEARCHTNSAALHGPSSGYQTRSFDSLSPVEAASVFHTVEALPLTLPNLLEMLVKCGLIYDESAALHAVVLMERYDARVRRVTFHMMHRLFVGALRVACKAHYDRNFSSSAFASCVGIKPQELKRLEATLLADLQWDVAVVGPPPPAPVPAAVCRRLSVSMLCDMPSPATSSTSPALACKSAVSPCSPLALASGAPSNATTPSSTLASSGMVGGDSSVLATSINSSSGRSHAGSLSWSLRQKPRRNSVFAV